MVYRNSSAVLTLPDGVTAVSSGIANFNGNDALAIVKGTPETYVDIFGRIGDSSTWSSNGISASDQTLRRKSTVINGITSNPSSGFPTLATEWDSYPIDTASGLGSHSIGASSPLAGYQDLLVTTTAVRVSGLETETSYSYCVRAANSGDTSDNSNQITVLTTPVLAGSGANTSILGSAATILVPPLAGFTNTNLSLDPAGTATTDFSLTESSNENSFSYQLSASEFTAFNGQYTLYHNGLGWTPATIEVSSGASLYQAQSPNFGSTSSQFNLSGLSGTASGSITITLNRYPASLESPVTSISEDAGNIRLSWSAVPNATAYRVEAADNPEGSYSVMGTTSNLYYQVAPTSRKFFRVIAIN